MDLHANAAVSLNKRRLLCRRVVEERWTLTKAAAAAEVSVRCARKWVARYRADGVPGLADRSSAPARVANRTPEDRGLGAARAREGPSSRGPARSARPYGPSLREPGRYPVRGRELLGSDLGTIA
jgi:hypothetical protein